MQNLIDLQKTINSFRFFKDFGKDKYYCERPKIFEL